MTHPTDLKIAFFNEPDESKFYLLKLIRVSGKHQIIQWTNAGGCILDEATDYEIGLLSYNEILNTFALNNPKFLIYSEGV